MNGTYENIDCMQLMATLKDKEIDLAIVDPEYGIGFDSEKKGMCNNNSKKLSRNEYRGLGH